MKIDLQLFGGRGGSSGSGPGLPSGNGGGGGGGAAYDTQEMVTMRGEKTQEVDDVLTVARSFRDTFGANVVPEELQVTRNDIGATMAFYDAGGNLALNKAYFDTQKMNTAYDRTVQSGFHPARGGKPAIEAVAAHEMGHRLADVATQRIASASSFSTDKIEKQIVRNAAKEIKARGALGVANQISRYAKTNYSECIAEAVADVYCNGNQASRASQAVYAELRKALGR